MVWVADQVKEFWIYPDNQGCEFTVEGLTLLMPSGEAKRPMARGPSLP